MAQTGDFAKSEQKQHGISRLLEIMARLRDPELGCPWDLKQNFASIAPYTIEEAYEVADAIRRGDLVDLRDELGDLLLQVVFHSRMAEEQQIFDFDAVAEAVSDKMVRRHPHVFDAARAQEKGWQSQAWEAEKARERQRKAGADGNDDDPGALAGVPLNLPALARAQKLQKRAARVGFDWPHRSEVEAKLAEEWQELKEEIVLWDAAEDNKVATDKSALAEEFGDFLFAVVNLGRHLGLDTETCMRQANDKFQRRFNFVEDSLKADGQRPQDVDLDTMEVLWQQAKKTDKA